MVGATLVVALTKSPFFETGDHKCCPYHLLHFQDRAFEVMRFGEAHKDRMVGWLEQKFPQIRSRPEAVAA